MILALLALQAHIAGSTPELVRQVTAAATHPCGAQNTNQAQSQ